MSMTTSIRFLTNRSVHWSVGCLGILASVTIVLADSQQVSTVTTPVVPAAKTANEKLLSALEIARSSLQKLDSIKDYEATFSKREVVGHRLISQKMQLKIREEPFSVYLQFVKPNAGREVIFVQGRNDNKLLAHGTGLEVLAGTVKLHPTGRDAMKGNRYPITMVGMSNLLRTIIRQWEGYLNLPDVEVTYYPNAKLGDIECIVLQTTQSRRRQGVNFHMTRLFLDKQRKLPIRVEQYGFPKRKGGKPALLEEYTYSNVRPNIHLTDRDFDTSNPAYRF